MSEILKALKMRSSPSNQRCKIYNTNNPNIHLSPVSNLLISMANMAAAVVVAFEALDDVEGVLVMVKVVVEVEDNNNFSAPMRPSIITHTERVDIPADFVRDQLKDMSESPTLKNKMGGSTYYCV